MSDIVDRCHTELIAVTECSNASYPPRDAKVHCVSQMAALGRCGERRKHQVGRPRLQLCVCVSTLIIRGIVLF